MTWSVTFQLQYCRYSVLSGKHKVVPPLPVREAYSSGHRRWCCLAFSPPCLNYFYRPSKRKVSQVLLSFHTATRFNSIHTRHETEHVQLSLHLITLDFPFYPVHSITGHNPGAFSMAEISCFYICICGK